MTPLLADRIDVERKDREGRKDQMSRGFFALFATFAFIVLGEPLLIQARRPTSRSP
jgi:hypothetical protein